MKWKSLSYWFKGVLVVFALYIACIIFILYPVIFQGGSLILLAFLVPFTIAFFLDYWETPYYVEFFNNQIQKITTLPLSPENFWYYYIIYLIINLILIFLVGALIGWIYGKIKKKIKFI